MLLPISIRGLFSATIVRLLHSQVMTLSRCTDALYIACLPTTVLCDPDVELTRCRSDDPTTVVIVYHLACLDRKDHDVDAVLVVVESMFAPAR